MKSIIFSVSLPLLLVIYLFAIENGGEEIFEAPPDDNAATDEIQNFGTWDSYWGAMNNNSTMEPSKRHLSRMPSRMASHVKTLSGGKSAKFEFEMSPKESETKEDFVAKLLKQNLYFYPQTIGGIVVKRTNTNLLHSYDKTVNTLLKYVHMRLERKFPGKFDAYKKLPFPEEGCVLEFPLGKEIHPKAYLWDQAFSYMQDDLDDFVKQRETIKFIPDENGEVKQLDVSGEEKGKGKEEEENGDKEEEEDEDEGEEPEEEGKVRLGTAALLEAIYKGKRGFGVKNADGEPIVLDWSNIPKFERAHEYAKAAKVREATKRCLRKYIELLRKALKWARFRAFWNPVLSAFGKGVKSDPAAGETASTSSQIGQSEPMEKRMEEEKKKLQKEMERLAEEGKKKTDKKLKIEIDNLLRGVEDKMVFGALQFKKQDERNAYFKQWEDAFNRAEEIMKTKFEVPLKDYITDIKFDKKGHEKLMEHKYHPFEFLREVTYDIRIKPNDKRFKKITAQQYEQLVEFTAGPFAFLDKGEKLDKDVVRFVRDEMKRIKKKEAKQNNNSEGTAEVYHEHLNREESKIMEYLDKEFKEINNIFLKAGAWFKQKFDSVGKRFKKKKTEEQLKAEEEEREYEKAKKFRADFYIFTKFLDEFNANHQRPNVQQCYGIKEFISTVLHDDGKDDPDGVHREFRGRIGAQILNSVYNAKQWTKDIWIGMLASVAGAGGIAIFLDAWLWPMIITAITLHCPICGGFAAVTLYSTTPYFAETFDSFFIKRLIAVSTGGSFLPSTVEQFMEDMAQSSKAGLIAAVGSIGNNWAELYENWAGFGVGIGTNQIATSTSGAMIPLELAVMQKYQVAGLYKKYQEGVFPMPNVAELVNKRRVQMTNDRKKLFHRATFGVFKEKPKESKKMTPQEMNRAFRQFLKTQIDNSMDVDKGAVIWTNSMGIGSFISLFFYLLMGIPARLNAFGKDGATWVKIVTIMVNTPTEILSYGTAVLTANGLGSEWMENWLSTDKLKNLQMVRMICERTIDQMENGKFKEIHFDEVYKIYHPKLAISYPYGKGVVKVTNSAIGAATGAWKWLTKQKQPKLPIDMINVTGLAQKIETDDTLEDVGLHIANPNEIQKLMYAHFGKDEEKFEEFLNESVKLQFIHRLTLSESHHVLAILNEIMEENGQQQNINHDEFMRQFNDRIEQQPLYKKLMDAARNKVIPDIELQQIPSLEADLHGYESQIQLRVQLQECRQALHALKFTALKIDAADKDRPASQKEFLEWVRFLLYGQENENVDTTEVAAVHSADAVVEKLEGKSEKPKVPEKADGKMEMFAKMVNIFGKKLEGKLEKPKAPGKADEKMEIFAKMVQIFEKDCSFIGRNNENMLPKKAVKFMARFHADLRARLDKEIRKRLRKEKDGIKELGEQTLDLLRWVVNLEKFMKKFAEHLDKFDSRLQKSLEKLDGTNTLSEMYKQWKEKDSKYKLTENDVKAFVSELDNGKAQYQERLTIKLHFLMDNWKSLESKLDMSESDVVRPNHINFGEKGHLFVGYCLAKRFLAIFNTEGKPRLRALTRVESYLMEHAANIGQVMGQRRLDNEYYEQMEHAIQKRIENECQNGGNVVNSCLAYVKALLQEWQGFCSIDRKHTQFERPDEWMLRKDDAYDDDNFRLMKMDFLGLDVHESDKSSLQFGAFYQGAMKHMYEYKLTFTESHHILQILEKVLLSKNVHEIHKSELLGQLKNQPIFAKVLEESKQYNQLRKHSIQTSVDTERIAQKLLSIESNISLKRRISKCAIATFALRFTAQNSLECAHSVKYQHEFMNILRVKVDGGTHAAQQNLNNAMEKKVDFLFKMLAEFNIHCGFVLSAKMDLLHRVINAKNKFDEIRQPWFSLFYIKSLPELMDAHAKQKIDSKSLDVLHVVKNRIDQIEKSKDGQKKWSIAFLSELAENAENLEKKLVGLISVMERNEELIKKLNNERHDFEPFNKVMTEEKKLYAERMVEKVEFLVQNWLKLEEAFKKVKYSTPPELIEHDIEAKEEMPISTMPRGEAASADDTAGEIVEVREKRGIEGSRHAAFHGHPKDDGKLDKTALLHIALCLAKRFSSNFNEDGQVDIGKFIQTETNNDLDKYAEDLQKRMENRRLDKMFYEDLENSLEEQILKGCGDEKVTAECEAKRAMLDNWANFCHIDKRNTQLERPEELELHYPELIQMDGFHFANFKFLEIDMQTIKMRRDDAIKQYAIETMNGTYLHRVTLTEASYILSAIKMLLEDQQSSSKRAIGPNQSLSPNSANRHRFTSALKNVLYEKQIFKDVEDALNQIKLYGKASHFSKLEHALATFESRIGAKIHLSECRQLSLMLRYTAKHMDIHGVDSNQLLMEIRKHHVDGPSKKGFIEMKSPTNEKEQKAASIVNIFVELQNHCAASKELAMPCREFETAVAGDIAKFTVNEYGHFVAPLMERLAVFDKRLEEVLKQWQRKDEELKRVVHTFVEEVNKWEPLWYQIKRKMGYADVWRPKTEILQEDLDLLGEYIELPPRGANYGPKLKNSHFRRGPNKMEFVELPESREFRERLEQKVQFLLENANNILTAAADQATNNVRFPGFGQLLVGFCLTRRFMATFDGEGRVNADEFTGNEADQEYAVKLEEMLGTRQHLDYSYYSNLSESIKNELVAHCQNVRGSSSSDCEREAEKSLQKWHGYCSIDKKSIQFERVEELALVVEEDGLDVYDKEEGEKKHEEITEIQEED